MYQVPYCGGFQILVVGSGENGLCRVMYGTSSCTDERFEGTYVECEKWLADRGIAPHGGNTSHSLAVERWHE